MVLTPECFKTTLLVIPCSKSKVTNNTIAEHRGSLTDTLPPALAAELQEARKNVAERIHVDESTLMPAWRRYNG